MFSSCTTRNKPTLVDRFGREHTYLRISVTDRCNLRCRYCMPLEGIEWKPRQELLTYEEIVRIAQIFCHLGINKIRITGGEPTLRKNIEVLIKQLDKLPGLQTLAMTTNGMHLAKKAYILRRAGLSAINISLDTLSAKRFQQITYRDGHENVLKGIEASLSAGFKTVKLNVVVMAGVNEDEILHFINFVQDKAINVRFIEYMPFKDNQWDLNGFYSYAQMKETIGQHYELIPVLNETSSVAKDFVIPGIKGTVSFVTSMSDSFCGTCNRIRLTADGFLKSCLFYPAEISLKDSLRDGASDMEIAHLIQTAILLKPEGHVAMTDINTQDNSPMIQIGG